MPPSLHDAIPSENHLLEDVETLRTYFGPAPYRKIENKTRKLRFSTSVSSFRPAFFRKDHALAVILDQGFDSAVGSRHLLNDGRRRGQARQRFFERPDKR
jgi:hypothetical protein